MSRTFVQNAMRMKPGYMKKAFTGKDSMKGGHQRRVPIATASIISFHRKTPILRHIQQMCPEHVQNAMKTRPKCKHYIMASAQTGSTLTKNLSIISHMKVGEGYLQSVLIVMKTMIPRRQVILNQLEIPLICRPLAEKAGVIQVQIMYSYMGVRSMKSSL